MYVEHEDPEVRKAIIRLSDALCQWERNTGKESVLIIREQGGFEYRAVDGKPHTLEDISDGQIYRMLGIINQSRWVNRRGVGFGKHGMA